MKKINKIYYCLLVFNIFIISYNIPIPCYSQNITLRIDFLKKKYFGGYISDIKHSNNCKYIALTVRNNNFYLYDNSWNIIWKHKGKKKLYAGNVAFSNNNKFFVKSRYQNLYDVIIYDLNKRKICQTIEGEKTDIYSIALSRDDNFLAIGSKNGKIRIWKYNTLQDQFKPFRSIRAHTRKIASLKFSPSKNLLVSSGYDKYIKVFKYNSTNFALVKKIKAHKDSICNISFSSDGKYLASSSKDKTVKVWKNVNNIFQHVDTLLGHSNSVRDVVFINHDKYIATSSDDKSIRIWKKNNDSISFIKELENHESSVLTLDYIENNSLLISGSNDRTVKVWKVAKQNPDIYKAFTDYKNYILDVQFSPKGKYLSFTSGDNSFAVYNTKNWKKVFDYKGDKENKAGRVVFFSNEKYIAKSRYKSKSDVGIIEFLKNGKNDAVFKVNNDSLLNISLSSDDKLLCASSKESNIIAWERDNHSQNFRFKQVLEDHSGEIWGLDISQDRSLIVSCSFNKKIKIWKKNFTSDHYEIVQTLNDHSDKIYCVKFGPNNIFLASSGSDKTISVKKNNNNFFLNHQTLSSHSDTVRDLAFSINGKYIASASNDTTVKLWERLNSEYKLIKTFYGHDNIVYSVSISPDGKLMASGGGDGNVILWDISEYVQLDKDSRGPIIFITNPELNKGNNVIDDSKIYLSGIVKDHSGIDNVIIDGENVLINKTGEFSLKKQLSVGDNNITIQSFDIIGNESTKRISIFRPSPKIPESPKNVAKRWAAIIGISKYKDTRISSLRYAHKDAESFYNWIVDKNGGKYSYDQVKLLTNEDATLRNIKKLIESWLPKSSIKEDLVTIYFAGHGTPEAPNKMDNICLLPYDAEYKDISTTGYRLWVLEHVIKHYIKAQKVVVIIDACHSGGIGETFDLARRSPAGYNKRYFSIEPMVRALEDIGDGKVIFSATDTDQYSFESERWGNGHGVFTYFLIQGLSGKADTQNDSKVSLGELFPYVSQNVRRETDNMQSPIISGRLDPALTIGKVK